MNYLRICILLVFVVAQNNLAIGQGKPSAAEIAAKIANPTTAPAGLNHNFDFFSYSGDLPGASDQTSFTYLFQPIIPLAATVPRFTFRPALPVFVNQPVYNAESGEFESEFALGDVGFDLIYGTTWKSGFLLSGGVLGSMPTATGDKVSTGQWTLGPNMLIGIAKKWGVIGALVGHKWGIAGPGTAANQTVASVFITFPFADGTWQITSLPIISANHNIEGEKWSIPVNLGVAKTLVLGDQIFRVNVGYSHFLVTPELFSPESSVRLTITKVINLNFKK